MFKTGRELLLFGLLWFVLCATGIVKCVCDAYVLGLQQAGGIQ